MRVLVTGGTGFVGSHAVVALLATGHEVRLLVRRADQVPLTFAPFPVAPGSVADVVVGDVLDGAAVDRALTGCDAVVHAAAVYSLDARRREEMLATNEQAARLVLGRAVERGLDPVVHVSSIVALLRHGGASPDLPVGDMTMPYARTKVASELVARELQDAGAPVVTTYPGAVFGPHDPYTGDQVARLIWVVRGLFPLWPSGRIHCVDARENGEVLARAIEPGRGPRRYVVPGTPVSAEDLFGAVSAAIGRRRPHAVLPYRLGVVSTNAVGVSNRLLPSRWRYPADREGIETTVRDNLFDTSPAERELGVTARPWADTVRDTIESLVDEGHLKEKYRPQRRPPEPAADTR